MHPTSQNAICLGAIKLRRVHPPVQGTSWACGLELIGDDERLVARAGGCRCGCWRSDGPDPRVVSQDAAAGVRSGHDRGAVLTDLALVLIDGGEAISDFQALAHLAPVIGPVPSTSTVWRTLNETGDLQLARVNAAAAESAGNGGACWPPGRRGSRG